MPVSYREKLKNSPGVGPFLLYVLPLPLIIVIIQNLVAGQLISLIGSIFSLSAIWSSAWFIRKAHYLEWKSKKHKWSRSSRMPWRYAASILTGSAVLVISLVILKNNIFIAAITALLALAGIILRYGVDPQYDRNKNTRLVGITTEELVDILEEAENNLTSIEQSAKSLGNRELSNRLLDISKKTRDILEIIENDPKDLRKARKFLKVYLQGAQKVANQYASTPHASSDHNLEQNFRNVLTTIEQVIEEQKSKLLENDILDLDVKIEVLEAQLKHEGVI